MKKITIVFSLLMLTFVTILPIKAEEIGQNEVADLNYLFEKVSEINESYNNVGITSGQLMELMAIAEKESGTATTYSSDNLENYYRENSVTLFNPSDYNLESSIQQLDGGLYDGNPPHSDAEQKSRLEYINSVLQKEYVDDKYNKGIYTAYLYTSHYIENVTFDRTKSNEENFGYPVLAHIICENDIEAFNGFYSTTSGQAVMDNFITFANGYQTFVESGATKIMLDSIMNPAINQIAGNNNQYLNSLNNAGIIDTDNIVDASADLFDAYKNAVTSNPNINATDLIDTIYDGLSGGITYNIVESYVSTIRYLSTSLVLTSLVSPVLGGVIYYAEFLCNLVPTLSLARLYYGYQVRKADRFAVHVGLHERP